MSGARILAIGGFMAGVMGAVGGFVAPWKPWLGPWLIGAANVTMLITNAVVARRVEK